MKTLKYILLAIVAMAGFAACTNDDTQTDSGIYGDGVFFPVNQPSQILLEDGQSSIVVPIQRLSSNEALSVPILANLLDEAMDIFTVEDEASFSIGETETSVKISFDFDQIEAGTSYSISLIVGDDDNISSYGLTEYSFTVIYDPWTDLGTGYYREDFFTVYYSVPNLETAVTIQESDITPGLYRLVNVYSEDFLEELFGAEGPSYAIGGDFYIYINATDPDKVYIPAMSEIGQEVGVNQGYGSVGIISILDIYFGQDDYFGTLKNGIITFPVGGVLFYDSDGFVQTNPSGLMRIVLPGFSAIEPIATVEYEGILTDAIGDSSAVFNVTLNEDAASCKYVIKEDDLTADEEALQAAVDAIIDGTDKNAEELSASTRLKCLIEETGEYTAIFVPFSSDGKITGDPVAIAFEFSNSESVSPADFTAEFTIEDLDESYANITVHPVADNLRYYWGVARKELYDQAISKYGSWPAYEVAYYTSVAANYDMTLEEFITEADLISRGETSYFYRSLLPETDYIAYAYCVNTSTLEARSEVSTREFTTDPMPALEADFEKWIGTWTVKSTSSIINGQPRSFDVEIGLQKANRYLDISHWDSGIIYLENLWKENLPFTAQYDNGKIEFLTTDVATLTNGDRIIFGAVIELSTKSLYLPDEPFLSGSLTGDDSAVIENTTIEIQGSEYEVVGADHFYSQSGSLYLIINEQDPPIGPFTLTKKASAATSSIKSVRKSKDANWERYENVLKKSPAGIRKALVSNFNCVELH